MVGGEGTGAIVTPWARGRDRQIEPQRIVVVRDPSRGGGCMTEVICVPRLEAR